MLVIWSVVGNMSSLERICVIAGMPKCNWTRGLNLITGNLIKLMLNCIHSPQMGILYFLELESFNQIAFLFRLPLSRHLFDIKFNDQIQNVDYMKKVTYISQLHSIQWKLAIKTSPCFMLAHAQNESIYKSTIHTLII